MVVNARNADALMAQLVDAWCERRALEPLRVILSCYPRVNGLTDEWDALAAAFKTVRVRFASQLPAQELEAVIGLQQLAESIVYRDHVA
jgi:hypothetical protein